MMNIETLTTFFGWVTLVNVGILLFTTLALMLMHGWVERVHGRLFGLSGQELNRAYFQYLAQFKIVTIVFCLGPYLALVVMAR